MSVIYKCTYSKLESFVEFIFFFVEAQFVVHIWRVKCEKRGAVYKTTVDCACARIQLPAAPGKKDIECAKMCEFSHSSAIKSFGGIFSIFKSYIKSSLYGKVVSNPRTAFQSLLFLRRFKQTLPGRKFFHPQN